MALSDPDQNIHPSFPLSLLYLKDFSIQHVQNSYLGDQIHRQKSVGWLCKLVILFVRGKFINKAVDFIRRVPSEARGPRYT